MSVPQHSYNHITLLPDALKINAYYLRDIQMRGTKAPIFRTRGVLIILTKSERAIRMKNKEKSLSQKGAY